jgi:hypothetical protein
MTAYDKKKLTLSYADQDNDKIEITAQIDIHGDGTWVDYQSFTLEKGKTTDYIFPENFSAYWIRFVTNKDTKASAQLIYR